MSFLNALASDGLSVGLRFYNARLNETGPAPAEIAAAPPAPAEESCPAKAEKTKTPAPPQSLEEMAAGRAEAGRKLTAEGLLGRLTAPVRPNDETKEKPGEQPDDEGKEQAAAQADPRNLTEEEKKQVQEMKQRDQEVRTHEQAHVAAAAGLAGAPSYEYQTGPDGRRYAVGGHVDLRTSGSSDPEKALREAEAVKRAAHAPADPSGTDRAAAARAASEINRIKAEKAAQNQKETKDGQSPETGPQSLSQSLSQKALSAYAAAKFGLSAGAARPALATI